MASREKISFDPLLVEITWHTNTKPYECGSEKISSPLGKEKEQASQLVK